MGKITSEGLFLEELERQPEKYLPEVTEDKLSSEVVQVWGCNCAQSVDGGMLPGYGKWRLRSL